MLITWYNKLLIGRNAKKRRNTMKRTLARALCIAIAIIMIVPTFVSMVSAADLVNLYDASKAVCGTPNSSKRDTEPKYNANYFCSDVIYVKEGDVITAGPVFVKQGYYFTAYKADGSVHTKQVKYADCTEIEVIQGNLSIVKWTVPAGVDSIRMATSQIFAVGTLITKNQEFGKADYLAYMAKNNVDLPFFTGKTADTLTNIFPAENTFAGLVNTKGETANDIEISSDYIAVKEGDMIYYGANLMPTDAKLHQLVLYDADKKATTNVNTDYTVFVGAIDDTYGIYAYKLRPGTAYVRIVADAKAYNEGKVLATFNQPFSVEGYNNYLNPPAETEPAPETTKPAEPVPTGDSSLVFAAIAVISLIGVATVAKRREN